MLSSWTPVVGVDEEERRTLTRGAYTAPFEERVEEEPSEVVWSEDSASYLS